VNKDLYNSAKGEIEFPQDKQEHMRVCFHMVKNADENTEGYNRNKELQGQSFIDYKQLKRIKNFFDNFKGSEKHPSFILETSHSRETLSTERPNSTACSTSGAGKCLAWLALKQGCSWTPREWT